MSGNLAVSTINGVDVASSPVATQAFANSYDLGVGQTWQDVTGSRGAGATYTNSTGKPIMIGLQCTPSGTNGYLNLTINSLILTSFVKQYNGGTSSMWATAIIPNGSTYNVSTITSSLTSWFELR